MNNALTGTCIIPKCANKSDYKVFSFNVLAFCHHLLAWLTAITLFFNRNKLKVLSQPYSLKTTYGLNSALKQKQNKLQQVSSLSDTHISSSFFFCLFFKRLLPQFTNYSTFCTSRNINKACKSVRSIISTSSCPSTVVHM